MTALGQIYAGSPITAAMLRGIAPYAVIKGADEPLTSSTSLQADNDLVLAVSASTSWLFECFLDYEGGTQGSSDIKWTWAVPAGATLRYTVTNITTGGSSDTGRCWTESSIPTAGTSGATNLQGIRMAGTFLVAGTAGNLQLKWAQNSNSGTPTIVHAQSSLQLWQQS